MTRYISFYIGSVHRDVQKVASKRWHVTISSVSHISIGPGHPADLSRAILCKYYISSFTSTIYVTLVHLNYLDDCPLL